jgi:hypothetical protein
MFEIFTELQHKQTPFMRRHAQASGCFLVEDVEDAHPQHEDYHRQHEDAQVEVDISRMLVSSPKTIVIQSDSEQYHSQHEDAATSC